MVIFDKLQHMPSEVIVLISLFRILPSISRLFDYFPKKQSHLRSSVCFPLFLRCTYFCLTFHLHFFFLISCPLFSLSSTPLHLHPQLLCVCPCCRGQVYTQPVCDSNSKPCSVYHQEVSAQLKLSSRTERKMGRRSRSWRRVRAR